MADLIKSTTLMLIGEKCFKTLFIDKYFDVPCFRVILSKILGLGLIAGSMMVNMPQVLKILNNKSGGGINLFGVFLNLAAITFHMSYSFVNGYPFSAWGDTTFLALQTAVIAALVLHYNGDTMKSLVFCLGYAILVYLLNCGMTPISVLSMLQTCNIPLVLGGKLSQAVTCYRNGSTGQLSAITAFLLLLGSLARIFTSLQETGDRKMVLTFVISSFANGVIAAQMLYYWNVPTKSVEKKRD